ncbi:ATP-dependent rRNA helicase RRP3 [Intoshia linei]|uniref:RNA helicase n=1 Tax=Intoshia linei TaxID=1819745 RepID=A0A177B3U3_9BILA|nr:ATP-dependent rRNA helicase RRP3 [Intoshia linei]
MTELSGFKQLGVIDVLCDTVKTLNWTEPTKIQKESIPNILLGKDVIGLAETGSGKTAAFCIPILQKLMEKSSRLFCLILTPTRELALQIAEQMNALGSIIGVEVATIVGGMNMVQQAIALSKKPHIVIGTPGRLVDHFRNTKGFNMKNVKFLVMDEADRILGMDFEEEVTSIVQQLPHDRQTLLFSATMTNKVEKLQRACLKDALRIDICEKYQTVEKLSQNYCFIPSKFKDGYLICVLNQICDGKSVIVFCSTCNGTQRVSIMLKLLGYLSIPLNGQMSQEKRIASLNKFRHKSNGILVATDVASRGLDIPHVDCVINYDVPTHSKDYIHRVGRTARAGRSGKAITLVTQYDVELYIKIESSLGYKLPLYDVNEDSVLNLMESISEAQRQARMECREIDRRKRKYKKTDNDESNLGLRYKFKRKRVQK